MPSGTPERRHHYRLLHVQPDAPWPVIRASYRTLMTTLRQHPDLGGPHEGAARLNAAMSVLRDPGARERYDAELRRSGRAPTAARRSGSASRMPARGSACAWCGAASEGGDVCQACGAPLRVMPPGRPRELFGRRLPRLPRRAPVVLWDGSEHAPWAARWIDVSDGGFAVRSRHPLPPGRRLRLTDAGLQLVGIVLRCRADGGVFTLHGRLLRWAPAGAGGPG